MQGINRRRMKSKKRRIKKIRNKNKRRWKEEIKEEKRETK